MELETFMKSVDFEQLKNQKLELLKAIDLAEKTENLNSELLEGLLNLIDHIQDVAVDILGYPETEVYMTLEDREFESIKYKNKSYPTLKIKVLDQNELRTITIGSIRLLNALGNQESWLSDSTEEIIDDSIYCYMTESEMHLPIEQLISLMDSELQFKIPQNQNDLKKLDCSNWTTTELFNYAKTNLLISNDEEFENWKHDRSELYDTVKEHLENFPTVKNIALNQIQIQSEIQAAGFNIVTCGNCGTVLLHRLNESNQIDCFCSRTMDLSDCPDYWHEGAELQSQFNE